MILSSILIFSVLFLLYSIFDIYRNYKNNKTSLDLLKLEKDITKLKQDFNNLINKDN